MQTGVNLNVLGGFALQVDGQKGPDLPRKTRALLAVLAVDDAKPVSRETLAELLWPGRGPEQSKNSLKEAIYGLRKPLRAHDVVITRDGGLSLGAAITTDIATFRHLAGANELVAWRADVLFAFGPELGLQAAAAARPPVPIVILANNYDPIARGYVQSLSRPGGKVTGIVSR